MTTKEVSQETFDDITALLYAARVVQRQAKEPLTLAEKLNYKRIADTLRGIALGLR
jgi:hypothetical protein